MRNCITLIKGKVITSFRQIDKGWLLSEGKFIKRVKALNLGLLANTFHMNIEEISIYKSIVQAKDYITHNF